MKKYFRAFGATLYKKLGKTEHNDTQPSDTQHNEIHHRDTLHNDKVKQCSS